MLKFHQVQRIIKESLNEAGYYKYLGRARSVYYFLHRESERRDPLYRLLALHLLKEKREMELRWGVSYFNEVGPLAVAPIFSRWQAVTHGSRGYSSKKSAKAGLESLMGMYDGLTTGPFALLHKDLADERQVGALFHFFNSHRQQLANAESEARDELKRLATPKQVSQILALLDLGDTVREDDELDLFLDSLGEAGTPQGSGGFTLDRSQALAKLGDYQLHDPVFFPLFAAVGLTLAGADQIEIEIDSDETWIRFTGTQLSSHFLEEIPGFLLSSDSSPRGPSLQALGRSLLQGAGSEPVNFQLEIPDRVISLMGFPDVGESVLWPDGPQSGTFYLRRPLGWKIASRYWKSRSEPHPEVPELLTALAYLPVPWSVNETVHTGRLRSREGAVMVIWRDEAVLSMAVDKPDGGFVIEKPSPIPATVIFCLHPSTAPALTGILSGLRMEMPPHSFVATTDVLLWLPRLATDLSGGRLVECQLLVEMLRALEDLQEAAWAEFAKIFSALPSPTKEQWVEPLLTLMERDLGAHPALADVPFLPLVGEEAISWSDWMRFPQRFVAPLSGGFRYRLRDDESVVLLSQRSMMLVTGMTTVEDRTRKLEQMARYQERLGGWLAQPSSPFEPPQETADGLCVSWSEVSWQGWMAVTDTRKAICQVWDKSRRLPYQPWKWTPPYVALEIRNGALSMDLDWKVIPESVLMKLPELLLQRLPDLADLFTEEILKSPLRREQFCYILAFLKARGKSITRWEKLDFLPDYRSVLVSLKERPEHLTKMVNEML